MTLENNSHPQDKHRHDPPDAAVHEELLRDSTSRGVTASKDRPARQDGAQQDVINLAKLPDIYALHEARPAVGSRDPETGASADAKLEIASANIGLDLKGAPWLTGDTRAEKIRHHRSNEARDARITLLRSAEHHIKDAGQLSRFRNYVKTFEKRAHTDHLTPAQVARTFDNVNRLLVGSKNAPISLKRQVQLGRDVMRQAADPTVIDQGDYNTCNVTTLQNVLFTKQPDEASRLVADVGTTGSFVAKGGVRVKVDRESMIPDDEANHATPVDDERSYATQIFNVTSVNLHYQKDDPNLRYVNDPKKGELLMDFSKHPPVNATDSCGIIQEPDLTDDQIIEIYRQLSGTDGKDILLTQKDNNDADNSTVFTSKKDFTDKLMELKREGKLPLVLSVNTTLEPFYTESGGGDPKGYEGDHVVVVRDIEPGNPPRVAVDDQYGKAADHLGKRMMSAEILYRATLTTPDAIKYIKKEIAEDKAHGVRDSKKIAELKRLRKFTPSKDCD